MACDDANALGSSAAWFRFLGIAGTILANAAPSVNSCSGTQAPGWYRDSYPIVGATTTGTVCYNWSGNTCFLSNLISVTNCNGYYIYLLSAAPTCSLRYCTM